MASLGSLVVSLAANTAQFTSDLGKAAHEAAKRMEDIKKTADVAGKAIAAVFVAGVGTASVLVKQAIDSADALDDLAQKSGASVEALSGLAHVAAMEGIALEGLSVAMARLSKNTADAAAGTGEARGAFDALGISVKNADGTLKNSDAIITDVAAKFAKMEDGAGKTALAVQIFGKSGADLIPVLNMGADGLAQATEEARQFGLVLSGDTAAAAAAFNDNLTRLNQLKKGFSNQIMQAVLPSLEGLTNRLIDTAKSSNGLAQAAQVAATGVKLLASIGAIVVGVFKTIGEHIGGMAAILVQLFSGNFKAAFDTAIGTVINFKDNVVGAAGNVAAIWDDAASSVEGKSEETGAKFAAPLVKAAQKSKQATAEIARESNKAYEAIEKMIDGIATQADTFGKSERETTLFKMSLMGATEEQLNFTRSMYDAIDTKQKDIDLQSYANRVYEDSLTPLEKYSQEIERLNEAQEKGLITSETYARAVANAQAELDKFSENGKTSLEDLKKAVEGWGQSFTDTFVDGVMEGKLSFKSLADSIIRDILRIATQKQALNALGNFGDGYTEGSGILGTIGSFFGGGRALGGDVRGGASYLVGERGPEIFTPATNGAVIPNGAAGRNVVINQNVTFASGVDPAQYRKDLVKLKELTKVEIMADMARA